MRTRRAILTSLALAALMPSAAWARAQLWPGFRLVDTTTLPAPPQAAATQWTLLRTSATNRLVTLVWAQASGASAAMDITAVERRGPSAALYRSVVLPGVFAAINGSFFQGAGAAERPMGLVRIGGTTRHPPSGRQGGGFLIAGGRHPRVVTRDQVGLAQAAPNVIESSPILVFNGQTGMRRDDRVRADRVAVGTTQSGSLFLIGAFGAAQDTISLFEFEQLAGVAASTQGQTIAAMIAMDGGPSAHLILPAAGRLYGEASSIYLTNLVTLSA